MKTYIICLLLLIMTPTISIAEDTEFALEIKDNDMDSGNTIVDGRDDCLSIAIQRLATSV